MKLGFRVRAAIQAFLGSNPPTLQLATSIGGSYPRKGTRELLLMYRNHWWFRAVVQFVASRIARTSWELYRPKGGKGMPRRMRFDSMRELRRAMKLGDLTEIEQHPVIEILQRPCPALKGVAAHKVMQVWLEVAGERFAIRNRDAQGRTVELWPMAPHWVQAVPSLESRTFRFSRGRLQGELPAEDVIWTKELDAEDPYGRGSGLGAALQDEVSTDDYAAELANTRLAEGGVPALIVGLTAPAGTTGQVTKDDVQKTAQEWERDHKPVSSGGKGKPIRFVNSDVKIQNVSQDFAQLAIKDLRAFARDAVQLGFGIAPEELGIVENSNRATIDSAEYLTALNVLQPRLEFIRDDWQVELVDEWDDRLVLGFDSPIPDDYEFIAAVMQAHPHAFQVDEVRDLADRAELEKDSGKVFPVKAGMQFVADYGAVVQQKPAPAEQDPAKRDLPPDPAWAEIRRMRGK